MEVITPCIAGGGGQGDQGTRCMGESRARIVCRGAGHELCVGVQGTNCVSGCRAHIVCGDGGLGGWPRDSPMAVITPCLGPCRHKPMHGTGTEYFNT